MIIVAALFEGVALFAVAVCFMALQLQAMGLLQPESGLLFWRTLAFGAFFILFAKFGFPVIIKAREERKRYIDYSHAAAHEARRCLSDVENESRRLRMEAEAHYSVRLPSNGTGCSLRHGTMRLPNGCGSSRRLVLKPKRDIRLSCKTPGSRSHSCRGRLGKDAAAQVAK